MAKQLYVGNLPYDTGDNELRQLFAPFGKVLLAQVITNRKTGASKGFGFVEMESDHEAEMATTYLNGKLVSGRTLIVNAARPKPVPGKSPASSQPAAGGDVFQSPWAVPRTTGKDIAKALGWILAMMVPLTLLGLCCLGALTAPTSNPPEPPTREKVLLPGQIQEFSPDIKPSEDVYGPAIRAEELARKYQEGGK